MVLAQIPQLVVDVGTLCLAVGAILTGIAAVSKLSPSKWVWKQLVGEPLSEWFQSQTASAVETITMELVDPRIEQIVGEQQTIRQMVEAVQEQTSELKPNAGASIADKVTATALKVVDLEVALDVAVEQRVEADKKIAVIDEKLTDGIARVTETLTRNDTRITNLEGKS